jgi:hypothetical protein
MANTTVTAVNVYNDANAFQADFNKALTDPNLKNVQANWKQVITDLGNLIDDSISLVGGNSALASTAGLAASLITLNRMVAQATPPEGFIFECFLAGLH